MMSKNISTSFMGGAPMSKHEVIGSKSLLCTIDWAAKELGVPKTSLRNAAERHGFIVRMGQAIRLETDRLGELVKKCRDHQKVLDSTNTNTGANGTSLTQDASHAQRAVQIAQTLKKSSRATLQTGAAKVLPMNRRT
jgi:t-SNARE complex subunit (syntaxin)